MAIERYIGGGKLYFAKFNGVDYDTEVEIGEIQSASLKVNANYTDALSKDTGVAKKVDKVATSTDSSISFTTQNVNKENMAMAMFGDLTTETFAIGELLPDGTVATAEVTIPVIIGAQQPKVEGKLRLVGVNVTGTEDPVLLVHHAAITPSGDVRDYFADKHSTLGFDGEVMEINGEYFKEYFIPKA
ncbi:MAG: hypothetical protein GQ570_10365 [Helicobacteraceae bacterium]|nr:hypothetical protein [Helicobacteraceae bacterium]